MPDYYFNFPPITALTLPQQAALNEVQPIALLGGPGTGKSFVSLWRHISKHTRDNPIRSQLLTFTTSLAYYLKSSSATQDDTAAEYVDSIKNWYYNHGCLRDEIIIDEAQDMPLDFYSENNLGQFSNRISYGADNKQILTSNSVNPDGSYNTNNCAPEEDLRNTFNNRIFTLDRNFRNTKRILEFAKATFRNAYIPISELNSCRQTGDLPRLFITNGNLQAQNETILSIIEQFYENESHNIGILTPLANKPWDNGESLTAKYYYDFIKDTYDCSYYIHNMEGLTSMKSIHITPFKSAKGLEFDTVIIPCFEYFNRSFRVIDWKDFFVGVTRAKSNLFLFSNDELPKLYTVVDKQYIQNQQQNPADTDPFADLDDLPF